MTLTIKEQCVLRGALHDRDYLVSEFIPRHRNGSDILKKVTIQVGVRGATPCLPGRSFMTF